MGQKAEEQKVSTVKTSTSIRDMTRKLSEEIDIEMGLAFHLLKWEKLSIARRPPSGFVGGLS